MVVNDFNVSGTSLCPDKAKSPLLVYPNTVLTLAITGERFEPIARRRPHEVQSQRSVQLRKFSLGDRTEGSKPLRILPLEKRLRILALERQDHCA